MYHGEELQSSGIHAGAASGPILVQQVDPEPETPTESNQGTSGPSNGLQTLKDIEFRIKELYNRRFLLMEMERFMKKTQGTSESPPGTSESPSGTSESSPGTSESPPGTSESPPGTSESSPGTSESPPGTSESSPGTSESSPGTSESPPGTSESSPGTSESSPGTSESPPGTSESSPGTSESPSGTWEDSGQLCELEAIQKELDKLLAKSKELEKHGYCSRLRGQQGRSDPALYKAVTPYGGVYTLPPLQPAAEEDALERRGNVRTTADVVPVDCLSQTAAVTKCPSCDEVIFTEPRSRVGVGNWLICFLCIVSGCVAGCCLIPFCMKRLSSIQHHCPKCRAKIHTHRPL